MIDPEKLDAIALWTKENTGKRFRVYPSEAFETYTDNIGEKHVLRNAPAKDPIKLVLYLKHYIDISTGCEKLSQVEFNEKYTQFRIYEL